MTSPYARTGARLVDQGYSAIPCMPGSKMPGHFVYGKWHAKLGWNAYGDRRPTDAEVDSWSCMPDAGVCLVLDETVKVIDIDTDDRDMLAAIVSILPESPVKKRGAKGFSVFYRGSPNIVARSFNVPGRGRVVDLLAYGKQTVLPPTIHPDTGQPYTWIGDSLEAVSPEDLQPLDDDIADAIEAALAPFGYVAPLPLVERVAAAGDSDFRTINDIALSRLADWVPHLGLERLIRTHDGYRSVASFRPSGSGKPMHKRNLHLGINAQGIRDWGDDDKPYTPIDLVMVTQVVDFGGAVDWLRDRLGLSKPDDTDASSIARLVGNILARHKPEKPLDLPPPPAEPIELLEPAPTPIRAPIAETDPYDPRSHGGVMGAVSKWLYDSAWKPVPEFATLGALGMCSVLFGRRYTTPTGLGLNLYLIGLGGAGFGKDHSLKAVQALLADAGMQYLVGPGDFSSDSALEHVMRQRPCFVMPMDEIGMFFQGVTGRNSGGFEKRIRKVLLEIYTRSDGMWTGKQKTPVQGSRAVSDTASEPVYNPTISILGMSTPTEFYAGLTESNLKDGVVARMTIAAPSRRPLSRKSREAPVPPRELVALVKAAAGQYPQQGGNLQGSNWRTSTNKPTLYTVPWESDAVRDKWAGIEDWQVGAIDEDPAKDGTVSRAAEQTLKMATIRAVSRSPAAPVVRDDDIDWGWAMVSHSLHAIEGGVDRFMTSSDFEKLRNAILGHLEASGGSLALSLLLRKGVVKSNEPRRVEAALKQLAQSDLIYPVSMGARQTVRLKAA